MTHNIEILRPIREVVWAWGPDDRLTANFIAKELEDATHGYPFPIDVALLHMLQAMRTKCGLPIRSNSGFRSPAHNRKVGGASQSQHLVATAVDLTIATLKPVEIASLGLACGATGIGIAAGYCHLDVRFQLDNRPANFEGWEYLSSGKGSKAMTPAMRAKIVEGMSKWV